jgi:AraC-like DNA-binding protein
MKPLLEKVLPPEGASWAWLDRRLEGEIPFQWHHHPEFELTLTLNSRGQRFIGDHIGAYDDGDLVLIGPNLPHTWASREKLAPQHPHVALVMWFRPEWAEPWVRLAEFRTVAELLYRARAGLEFSATSAKAARPLIETLFTLPAGERLLRLMQVLDLLSRDGAAVPLASPAAAQHDPSGADRTRIDRVLEHIHQHYAGGVSIPELADIAALSPSGLHRLFRRHTRQAITEYVMRLRLGEACALLSGTGRPIAHIAEATGYASLANFNRQFKAQKRMTPRAYRQHFQPS